MYFNLNLNEKDDLRDCLCAPGLELSFFGWFLLVRVRYSYWHYVLITRVPRPIKIFCSSRLVPICWHHEFSSILITERVQTGGSASGTRVGWTSCAWQHANLCLPNCSCCRSICAHKPLPNAFCSKLIHWHARPFCILHHVEKHCQLRWEGGQRPVRIWWNVSTNIIFFINNLKWTTLAIRDCELTLIWWNMKKENMFHFRVHKHNITWNNVGGATNHFFLFLLKEKTLFYSIFPAKSMA